MKRKKVAYTESILARMDSNAQAIVDYAERRRKGSLRSAAYEHGCALIADIGSLRAAMKRKTRTPTDTEKKP